MAKKPSSSWAPMEGDIIYACSRKNTKNGVGEFTPLQMSAAPKQCQYFRFVMKRSSRIKTHSVITDNCKKMRPEYQPAMFDSTTCRQRRLQFKDHSYRRNTTSELKSVFEMIAARHDTSGKTTTPLTHSCSNHGVIEVGPPVSDAMFEVLESVMQFFRYLKCQDDLYRKLRKLV